ncbi:helix-turn-helix domain-containing protein [Bhargavaea ginsengi]|uniref:helix-turn-helix domain-containing protein n=1 Tax=Bhargavaea ginsengi TaxID=426757 RepID=UPI003C78EC49
MKETFGQHIKQRRQGLGWTHRDLENASGVSNATISRVESEVNKNPRWETMRSLLDGLDRGEGKVARQQTEKAPTVSLESDKPFRKVKGLLQAGFKVTMTYDEETDLYQVKGFTQE